MTEAAISRHQEPGPEEGEARRLVAFIDDPEWRRPVETALAAQWPDVVCGSGGLAAACAAVSEADAPAIMLVDLVGADDPEAGIRTLVKICGDATQIIALGTLNDVSFYRRLIDAGAKDYLVKPVQPDVLAAAIDSAGAPRPVETPARKGARIAVVIGTRGGAGASMVAVNAAWSIAHDLGKSVALVDLDLSFGTVALALDLEPTHGLREILENPERVDSLFIKSALVRESENLFVLGAEEPLDDQLAVNATALEALLSELSNSVEVIVADMPRNLVSAQRALLARAETVVLVAEPTLAAIRDTIRLAAFVREAADATLIVVANKADKGHKGEITKSEFERGIKMPVDHVLPWNPKVAGEAANAGKPLALVAAGSDIARAVAVLGEAISGEVRQRKSSGRLLDALFGRWKGSRGQDRSELLRLPS